MNEFFTILTTVGAAKLANATALGTTVEISEMAVGDGGGKAVTPDQSQTSLVHTLRRKPLNSIRIDPDNPNWIVCEQVLPPDIGGWTIREVGLFDSAGDLIAVGNFPETYKPLLSEGSGRTQTIRIILEVSSASSVELKVDPSVVLATREYVNQQDASILQQAKDYASQQDTNLKAYVDTQDKSYQTVAKADASKKANQALSDAKGYADSQDAKMLASAKADASSKANAAESAAKNYAQSQDTSLKSYVDTQDKSYQTAASTDASKKANQALADAKSYADSQDAKMLASAKADASSKANAAESGAKNYAQSQDTSLKSYVDTQDKSYQTAASADASKKANQALSDAKGYADSQDAKMLASAKADASSKANAAESAAKNYAQQQDTALRINAHSDTVSYISNAGIYNPLFSQNVNEITAYNRIARLVDLTPEGGSFFQAVLSGVGNFGGTIRALYLITFACRGTISELKVLRLSGDEEMNPPTFYTEYSAPDNCHYLFCHTGPYWFNTRIAVLSAKQGVLLNERVSTIPTDAIEQAYAHVMTNTSFVSELSKRFQSGEHYFYSNGKLIQYGVGKGAGNVTLPIAFPNSFDVVLVTNTTRQGSYVDNAFGYVVDLSTFYAATKRSDRNGITGYPYAWLAIGE